MSIPIAWGITGASHFLYETFDVMERMANRGVVKITTYISKPGVLVVKTYGLWDKLNQISNGKYLQEIITDSERGFFLTGRFVRKIYKAFIVSPATANTVAKVVHGIADSLVTSAIAQAQKGGVSVYIVPTDQQEGFIETSLLYRVDESLCKRCKPCPAAERCPYGAIVIREGLPVIDLASCRNCKACISACSFGAIKSGEKAKIRMRRVDLENVRKLKEMEGITVLSHPKQIEGVLESLLSNYP